MNKLKMESVDITEQNIDKIAELFPQVVTEVADPSGEMNDDGTPRLRKAIDFEKLKLVLSAGSGDYVVADDDHERYEFTWVGKRKSMIDAAKPIRKTLRPCPVESKNWDSTENLYIEGDNLEVLKLLQESYLGKVKMIYIDPPYNTGNDFVYRDNFAVSSEQWAVDSGQYDEDENRLFQNTETNGRFHSDWCSMIYPRLQLARNLLTDDGVILVSIDDNEIKNLREICNEIFGEDNFVAQMVWQGGKMNAAKFISASHEYVLVYAKNLSFCSEKNVRWKDNKKGLEIIYKTAKECAKLSNGNYDVATEQFKKWYKNAPEECKSHSHYCNIDETGIFCMDNVSRVGGGKYTVKNPINGLIINPPSRGWVFGKEDDFWKAYNDGVIVFQNNNKLPILKRYLHNNEQQLLDTVFYKDRRGARIRLKELMGSDIFDFPKDEDVIKNLTNAFTETNADIILDFFSGSATTAHAVMQLNAEDGGNRKFIMVQLPEKTDAKSEAYKAGYKNICEIGKERIRRAGEKIKKDNKDKENIEKLDIGFRVFKADTTNMKDVYYAAGELSQKDLFDTVSNIKDDRSNIDLLYGCLLDWGVELSMPHSTEKIEGYMVHTIDSPLTDEIDLVACFDNEVSESVVRTIAERKPTRAVFRDASFADSANKINVFEIFKSISPDTTVKVI